ncbi:MAG TPA: PHP-associated domain-containing protein [Bryobacteraceae bacterium]|nr:PHP-associated domain-containing protein [Bryobacteraceae bacterium]
MKCDLHVHTRHSGMCTIPLVNRVCRECYSEPEAVYQTLKRRGMDLVTVTDHDSIDAAEQLRRYPDFFLSEEVTCITPSGTEIHVGVYGIEDRHHVELQRRRKDVPSLAAYLREQRIFFSINHVFSSLTGRRNELDFPLFAELFPAMETLNGHIPVANNRSAARLAEDWRKAPLGGSDAHTTAALGLTYTEASAARDIPSFLEDLRHGRARVGGANGSYVRLTHTVLGIAASLVRETPWTALLAPLALVVPVVTLVNYFCEVAFHARWSRRLWPASLPDPAYERAES